MRPPCYCSTLLQPAPGGEPKVNAGTSAQGPVHDAWLQAAECVAATGDLLATHRDTQGAQRSPTAWLLNEPEVCAAGFGALAHATGVAIGDATNLGLRMLQAGVDPRRARLLARLPATLGPATSELRALCSLAGPAHDVLSGVELARASIRTDNPIHELGDRLARLHRGAWQHVRERHVGVTTLTDYAALGVILHGHAAALLSTIVQEAGRAWARAAPPARRPSDRDLRISWRPQ
jgi:hypothetical protein